MIFDRKLNIVIFFKLISFESGEI